jgi:hypothetical protein
LSGWDIPIRQRIRNRTLWQGNGIVEAWFGLCHYLSAQPHMQTYTNHQSRYSVD